MDAVDGLSAEAAFEPRPAHWGESVPVVRLVTTMLTEHVHHIAEIGVLRDLRRGHALSQPSPPPMRIRVGGRAHHRPSFEAGDRELVLRSETGARVQVR